MMILFYFGPEAIDPRGGEFEWDWTRVVLLPVCQAMDQEGKEKKRNEKEKQASSLTASSCGCLLEREREREAAIDECINI